MQQKQIMPYGPELLLTLIYTLQNIPEFVNGVNNPFCIEIGCISIDRAGKGGKHATCVRWVGKDDDYHR
jgi:hypothetical protein